MGRGRGNGVEKFEKVRKKSKRDRGKGSLGEKMERYRTLNEFIELVVLI